MAFGAVLLRRFGGRGCTPVLVITPQAAEKVIGDDPLEGADWRPFVVFIDEEDGVLDERVKGRGEQADEREPGRRYSDRKSGACAMYTVRAGAPDEVSD